MNLSGMIGRICCSRLNNIFVFVFYFNSCIQHFNIEDKVNHLGYKKCITPMLVTEKYVSVKVVIKAALKILLFFLLQPESEVETDERGFKLYDGQ